MSLYHHSRPISGVLYGTVRSKVRYAREEFFRSAYLWLEREVGFYPLFLAVGRRIDVVRMTGFENHKGSRVLFSFQEINGVFMDYEYWHLVLNAAWKNYEMSQYEKRLIFKPSFPQSRWIRKALLQRTSVQIVVPELDLLSTHTICVHDEKAKAKLESLGFNRIHVKNF